MGVDNYKILYSSKDQFYLMVANKFQAWNSQLDRIESRINALVNMDSFQGAAADSVKAYLQDVYPLLLISIRQTLTDYQVRFMQYSNGYYSIDSDIYAVLPHESMEELKRLPPPEQSYLTAQNTAIRKALESISDILFLSVPSQSDLNRSLEDFKERVRLLDEQIMDYESANQAVANGDVASLVSSLRACINAFIQSRGGIGSYKPGDYAKRPEVLSLYQNVTDSMAYVKEKQEEILEAAEHLEGVYVQKQKDYEEALRAQQIEDRKDEGMATLIVGGVTAAVGVAVIIGTLGMATPVVVTAAVTGGCTAAYGVSQMAEGGQDYYYGSIGDVETAAWNPIRDTVFAGDQGDYDAWGNINMTIAGLCVPVGKAINTVAGSSATVIVKKVGVTVAKEMIQDEIVGTVSDGLTDIVVDELDLNKTQTVILKTASEAVLDKVADKVVDAGTDAIVKHRDGQVDGDFAEGMSYEDAKRYNKFVAEQEAARQAMNADSETPVDKFQERLDQRELEAIEEKNRIEADKNAEIDRIRQENEIRMQHDQAKAEAELQRIEAETQRVEAELQKYKGETGTDAVEQKVDAPEQKVDVSDQKPDLSTEDGVKAYVDKINAETDRINAEGQAEADRIRAEGVSEADRIRAEGVSEADRIRAEGETQAEKIRAEADAEAQQIKTESEANAQRIKAEAETDAQRIKAEAETDAQRIKAESEADAQKIRGENQANTGEDGTSTPADSGSQASNNQNGSESADAEGGNSRKDSAHAKDDSWKPGITWDDVKHGAREIPVINHDEEDYMTNPADVVHKFFAGPKVDTSVTNQSWGDVAEDFQ